MIFLRRVLSSGLVHDAAVTYKPQMREIFPSVEDTKAHYLPFLILEITQKRAKREGQLDLLRWPKRKKNWRPKRWMSPRSTRLRSRRMETATAGNKPDPTGPLSATLAPSRNCIGANAATSPLHKQKAPRVSPRGFCFLALAESISRQSPRVR